MAVQPARPPIDVIRQKFQSRPGKKSLLPFCCYGKVWVACKIRSSVGADLVSGSLMT